MKRNEESVKQILAEQIRIGDEILGSDGESVGKVTAINVGTNVVRVEIDKAGTVAYARDRQLLIRP